MQGTQAAKSPIEKFSTTKKFSMTKLMEKTKSAVLVKYEFELWEKFRLKCFPTTFRSIRILIQERKTNFFNWLLICMCCVFSWDFDGGNWIFRGWKLKVWISNEIKLKTRLLRFRCREENETFFKLSLPCKRRIFDADFGWRNHSCSY